MDIEITTLPNPRYGGEEAHHRGNLILFGFGGSCDIFGPQSEDAIKNAHFDEEEEEKELAQEVREATDSSSGRLLKGKSDGYRQRWRRPRRRDKITLKRRSLRGASRE